MENIFAGLSNQEKGITVNCSTACLIKDSLGALDQYERMIINCQTCLTSSEMNAKLAAKGALVNAQSVLTTSHQGDFVQISGGIPGQSADYSEKYLLVNGDLVLKKEDLPLFDRAAGMLVTGTLYYPEGSGFTALSELHGAQRTYPSEAWVTLEDQDLAQLLLRAPADASLLWVPGEVTALEEEPLRQAKERGLRICCDRLFSYEGLYRQYQELFRAQEIELAPDGHAIAGGLRLDEGTPLFYGDRIYLRGGLDVPPENAEVLKQFTSLIVNGRVTLPRKSLADFKAIGKAESYRLCDGGFRSINGFSCFTHPQLASMAERGEKMELEINGFVYFADDVTAADMEVITAVNCNGAIMLPDAAMGTIEGRSTINGAAFSSRMIQEMTGMSIPELIKKMSGGSGTGKVVNTDFYLLL